MNLNKTYLGVFQILVLNLAFLSSCQNAKNKNHNRNVISESPYIYYFMDRDKIHYFDERFKYKDSVKEIYELGKKYFSQKKIDSSIYQMNKTLKIDSLSPILLNNLGNFYRLDAQFDKAIPLFNKAINLSDSIYIPSLKNLAELYATLGEQEKSEEIYFYILNNFENDIQKSFAHAGLVNMYYKYGYIEKAEIEIKKAKELLRNDKDLLSTYNKLEEKINLYYSDY